MYSYVLRPSKNWIVVASIGLVAIANNLQAAEITGAGSSFAAPIFSKWAFAYAKETDHKVNYQSVGSSSGIKQITAKTVDFGASDKPLKEDQLKAAGLVQFPSVIGGVVPIVNIPNVKSGMMRIDGKTLADIYRGKITKWNDPALKNLNPDLKLPDIDILVIRRADGSGTTFLFTNYLSKISQVWKETIGEGTTVSWPVGSAGKGNEGVSAFVSRLKGAIGYVEYAYAKQNHMTYLNMMNAEGNLVSPHEKSFKAAAAGAKWETSFYQVLTNQPGKEAWPISGAVFVMMQQQSTNPENTKHVLKFFEWAFKQGATMASELDYVPLPESVININKKVWKTIQ